MGGIVESWAVRLSVFRNLNFLLFQKDNLRIDNQMSRVNYPKNIKFKTEFEKGCLIRNFEKRGWTKVSVSSSDDDWNFFWATVGTVHSIFSPMSGIRLTDSQRLNHFPNHYELTRKDLMIRNIKRYKREERGLELLDHVPMTFILPGDYPLFSEEFSRQSGGSTPIWIMKPAARSQGYGIFIITKLSQVRKWASQRREAPSAKDQYVISKYITNPLLVGGLKFDLRMYCLVTSYRPLKAYMYARGFARFCTVKYTMDTSELENPMVHLTNVAVQKKASGYNARHGGKWPLKSLRLFLEQTRGREATQKLFDAIDFIVVHSLRACQNVIMNDKHCFECYGFDIIIDSNLKPWLIEINASPSLTASTRADRIMKTQLIDDILNVVMPHDFWERDRVAGQPTPSQLGAFRCLVDEQLGFDSTAATGCSSTGTEMETGMVLAQSSTS